MSPRGLAYALILTLVLGLSFECIAGGSKRELEMLQNRIPVELTADVTWDNCGDWNGFYYPAEDTVLMCNENLDLLSPGAQRMVFLHELGHAYATEYHLDLARWGGKWEDQADEFAEVMTLVQGRPEDLLAMALEWDKFDRQIGTIPGDTHSPAKLRAARLRSMYNGYKMLFGPDYFNFKEAVEFWRLQFLKSV